jgi:hypothetical protein
MYVIPGSTYSGPGTAPRISANSCTYLIKLGKRRRILRSWSLSSVNRPDSLAKTGLTIAAVQRHCLVFAVCTALGLHVGEAS